MKVLRKYHFILLTFRHPFISKEERDMIESSLGKQPILPSGDEEPVITISNDPSKSPQQNFLKALFASIPFKAIGKSIPFWGIMVGHVCQMFGFYILLIKLPEFFKEIMRLNSTEVSNLCPASKQNTELAEKIDTKERSGLFLNHLLI